MALDFPANPVDGQVYGNFYYSATKGAWRSTTSFNSPSSWKNAIGTTVSASQVPLTIQGFTSQTANLQEWKNSSGTTLTYITPNGDIKSVANLDTSGKVIGTTQPNAGSDGGVAIKAPASGSQTSAYLQFVNNSYSAQWGAISADPNSNMTVSASQLNLPTKTYAPGSVVQVITATSGFVNQSFTSTTPIALSGMSASITPKFSNSKILIQASVTASWTYVSGVHIYKNGSDLVPNHSANGTNNQSGGSTAIWTRYFSQGTDTTPNQVFTFPVTYWDTPGTTSSITYDIRANSGWAGGSNAFYFNNRDNQDMLSSSYLTLMEIAQ